MSLLTSAGKYFLSRFLRLRIKSAAAIIKNKKMNNKPYPIPVPDVFPYPCAAAGAIKLRKMMGEAIELICTASPECTQTGHLPDM